MRRASALPVTNISRYLFLVFSFSSWDPTNGFRSLTVSSWSRNTVSPTSISPQRSSCTLLRATEDSAGSATKAATLSAEAKDEDTALLDEIRRKRVRELKDELTTIFKIRVDDVFEKEELVTRLYQARRQSPKASTTETSTQPQRPSPSSTSAMPPVVTRLQSTSYRYDMSIQETRGQNRMNFDKSISTIQIRVVESSSTSPADRVLNMLLDTAATGTVLKASVAQKLGLRKLHAAATMTGAAGDSPTTQLLQFPRFTVDRDDDDSNHENPVFGPLPAVSQDLEALPPSVDGLLGLNFIQQFSAVDFDMVARTVTFHRTPPPADEVATTASISHQVVAEGPLETLPSSYGALAGLWVAKVWIGGSSNDANGGSGSSSPGVRGPVSCVVDTGAQTSFLNWSPGLSSLNLSRNSPGVQRISGQGAVGIGNQAFAIDHAIFISSRLRLTNPSSSSLRPGLSLAGERRWEWDIVSGMPILDLLGRAGVGGLLGWDIMQRCSAVRICCGNNAKLQFFDSDA